MVLKGLRGCNPYTKALQVYSASQSSPINLCKNRGDNLNKKKIDLNQEFFNPSKDLLCPQKFFYSFLSILPIG